MVIIVIVENKIKIIISRSGENHSSTFKHISFINQDFSFLTLWNVVFLLILINIKIFFKITHLRSFDKEDIE